MPWDPASNVGPADAAARAMEWRMTEDRRREAEAQWAAMSPEQREASLARQRALGEAREAASRRDAEEEGEWMRRRDAALAKLKGAGNAGLVSRRVPGRYHLTTFQRLFGRVGSVEPVDVEGAWPIGQLTFVRAVGWGGDEYKDLDAGLTPTDRIVPMQHGTKGDQVEMLYMKWRLPIPGESNGVHSVKRLNHVEVAVALEKIVERVGL